MTHKTDTEKVTPQAIEKVKSSVEKMRKNIYIYADATAEMMARDIVTNPDGKTDKDKYALVFDDFLLHGTHYDNMEINGSTGNGWIFTEPLLLKYARLTKQMITVPGELLDIKKLEKKADKIKITDTSLPNSESRIAVKSYLLRRIVTMQKDKEQATEAYRKHVARRRRNGEPETKTLQDFQKQKPVILFETLFAAAEITAPNSKTRIKEFVYNVLDYWQAKDFIKGYSKRRGKGKGIEAVTIEI